MSKIDFLSKTLVFGSRGILGLVFLFAAFPKIFNLRSFATIIDAYGFVPEKALLPVALLIAVLEVASGAGIFFNRSSRLSLFIISGLLFLFIGVLSYSLWLGFDIDCGCFGPNEPKHTFFSSLRSALYRDLFLLLPAAYLYWHGWQTQKKLKEIHYGGKEMDL
jgi:hypothetical protein